MKVILSHSGKQHSYQVALALHRLGMLKKFFTSSYIRPLWLQNLVLKSGNTYFSRRFIQGLSGSLVSSNWLFEFKEQVYRKLYGKSLRTQNAVYQRDILFDENLAKRLLNYDFDLFWGFQGSCLESLKMAKKLGKIAVCELTIAHLPEAKRILSEECQLNPEWADSIDNLVFPAIYEKRLIDEVLVADYVVVASGFSRQSLLNSGIANEKIVYLPLGFDCSNIPVTNRLKSARSLKLLYVGTLTQRKGIKYLLEAVKELQLPDFELHIIGGIQGSGLAFRRYGDYCIYHLPVSQQEMFNSYRNFDALVLPTVFEGFGLVIVEALAAGLPVITTSHSFGAEVIKDGENGFVVPIRDVAKLKEAIESIYLMDATQFKVFQDNAICSVQQFTWRDYRRRLEILIQKLK
jgi:alpha-maltose-1-phosphate synthase